MNTLAELKSNSHQQPLVKLSSRMDKFVKRENEMWKMPAKKRIQTRLVSASAVKRVLHLLSVCPATHLEMFRQKKNTHKLLRSNHPYYRNVAKHLWREPQIITFENSFSIWIHIGYICERTLYTISRVTSVHVLQTATYNLNFIELLLISSRISQNWFPTASGVLLLVSRIIYLNKWYHNI